MQSRMEELESLEDGLQPHVQPVWIALKGKLIEGGELHTKGKHILTALNEIDCVPREGRLSANDSLYLNLLKQSEIEEVQGEQ